MLAASGLLFYYAFELYFDCSHCCFSGLKHSPNMAPPSISTAPSICKGNRTSCKKSTEKNNCRQWFQITAYGNGLDWQVCNLSLIHI